MLEEPALPLFTAKGDQARGLLNTEIGPLQQQLRAGEYEAFRYAPLFESDFIQISRRGQVVDVHNRVRMVTVGVASTSPALLVPNVLLVARPVLPSDSPAPHACAGPAPRTLELTRLLPLRFVKLSVHDEGTQQLRLRLASGRSFYLQLCSPSDAAATRRLFALWVQLIHLLLPPAESGPTELPPLAPEPSQDAVGSLASVPPHEVDPAAVSIRSVQTPSPGDLSSNGNPSPHSVPDPLPREQSQGQARGRSPPGSRSEAARPRPRGAARSKSSRGRRPSRLLALVKSLSRGSLGAKGKSKAPQAP
ncbi:DNA-(apurinic or apyrimidinic site) lyase 2 isoform X2 [Alligator sinensis]|uniref:DNA-(Apurinic or apyrimidinic site) lyase 2 isoform X2 n=1 Tax=Alligator sinensis TaxID=38654 RepID=A0A3Q0HD23_ALLSI|nr:DNA-(apurinic or apyrimidinic site) lyase 2 isoform X2 [Alligator sinensis]